MDKSEYGIILLNETKKQLAVQKCNKDDEDGSMPDSIFSGLKNKNHFENYLDWISKVKKKV